MKQIIKLFFVNLFINFRLFYRRNVESGKEPGAAFAVYYKGKPVIDVWGGYTDRESETPWKRDTTTLVFSCSKGVAAIIMAKMAEL